MDQLVGLRRFRRYDALVLTHCDGDHMGGVDVVVDEGIGVSAFYDRGHWDPAECDEPSEQNSQVCQYRSAVEIETDSAIALDPGDQILLDSGVSVVVVASIAKVHRSDPSLSDEFLRLIRPEVAIVSAGSHCGFHHPRQTILDAMTEEVPGIEIFQTNRYDCDGPGGHVDSVAIGDLESEGAEGAIVITVGDAEYTVIVARTGGGMLSEIQ